MNELKGLATGIGSLPHKSAQEALDLIFENVPEIPFWPQLPKRDIREGMLAQFSAGLPCLKMTRNGVIFSPENKDEELERFYEKIISQDLEYFAIEEDYAEGLHAFKNRLKASGKQNIRRIKIHITGPFTFAAGLKDESGKALLHDPIFMQAVIKGLIMKTRWQIKFLEGFGKIIVFIDEPYLGCFGSAYTPLNRIDVVKGLEEFTGEIKKSSDAQIGVHCCGNTDWSIFTDVSGIDIINFDAFGFLDKLSLYAESLKGFFNRSGMLCWGIVPTHELKDTENPQTLFKKLKGGIDILAKKGLDKNLLKEQLLLSPACGLGTLDVERSERILTLLCETSSLVRKSL